MNKYVLITIMVIIVFVSGCSSKQSRSDQINDFDEAIKQHNVGLSISSEGVQWEGEQQDNSTFEDTIKNVSFEVIQPLIPFEVTNKAATLMEEPYNLLQLIFANVELKQQLVFTQSDSKVFKHSLKNKGPKLKNKAQTWFEENEQFSILYWQHNGITYSLMSTRVENNKFVPLYNVEKLVEIANNN